MQKTTKYGQLTVFFDGECILCRNEIKRYIRQDKNHRLIPVNIKAQHFQAESYDLDSQQVNQTIHSIDHNGKVYTGVTTLIQIYNRLPYWKYLTSIIELPVIYNLSQNAYDIFSLAIRPHLPKHKCENGLCKTSWNHT